MTTDQQLRFECLKIAAAIEPREDPRLAAEMLVSFVRGGGERSTAGSADRRTTPTVPDGDADRYAARFAKDALLHPGLEPGAASSIGVLEISIAEVRLRCFALTSSDQPFSNRISDASRYAKFAMAAADSGREDRVACLEALVSDEVTAIDEDFASKIIDRATALAFFVEAKANA